MHFSESLRCRPANHLAARKGRGGVKHCFCFDRLTGLPGSLGHSDSTTKCLGIVVTRPNAIYLHSTQNIIKQTSRHSISLPPGVVENKVPPGVVQ